MTLSRKAYGDRYRHYENSAAVNFIMRGVLTMPLFVELWPVLQKIRRRKNVKPRR